MTPSACSTVPCFYVDRSCKRYCDQQAIQVASLRGISSMFLLTSAASTGGSPAASRFSRGAARVPRGASCQHGDLSETLSGGSVWSLPPGSSELFSTQDLSLGRRQGGLSFCPMPPANQADRWHDAEAQPLRHDCCFPVDVAGFDLFQAGMFGRPCWNHAGGIMQNGALLTRTACLNPLWASRHIVI